MNEIGLQPETVQPWFAAQVAQGYTRVSVTPEQVATWSDLLCDALRRCYISDQRLQERVQATQVPPVEIVAAKLPDPGSVMSGDFGEIIAYLYLASRDFPTVATGPKRWRLKQDRTKPAPGADVIQFVLPQWPQATTNDRVICAEVKAKATAGPFEPIARAIEGSKKDRTSRLSRSLVWLRERALNEDIGNVTLPQLERFINATEFPSYARSFHAVAVICSGLVESELQTLVPAEIPDGCALVVISIPELRNTYTTLYEAVLQSPALDAAAPEVIA